MVTTITIHRNIIFFISCQWLKPQKKQFAVMCVAFFFLIRMAKSISLSENLGRMFENCNNLIVVTWNYDDIVEYKGKVIKCVSRAQL